MEVGYKNSTRVFPKEEFGPWRHCDEEDLNRVLGDHDAEKTGLKLCAMADAGKSDYLEQVIPRDESVLDMIRVAFYAHQVSEAVEMIHHFDTLGYETCANLMAVSNIDDSEIDTALAAIAPTPAGVDAGRRDGNCRQLWLSLSRTNRSALQKILHGYGRDR